MPEIIMPKAGDAMTEGKVVRWYKQPGDTVKKGEAVAEIETDKVNLDLEAEDSGTLGQHAAKEGDMVPVGGLLARILAEGEKDDAPAKEEAKAPAGDSQKKAAKPEDDSKKVPAKAAADDSGKAPADAAAEDDAKPEGDGGQQRRTTDRKESYKHSTGEYHEAIEQRGPRRDRTSPEPAGSKGDAEGSDHRRSSPLARRMAREMGVDLGSVQGSGPRGRIVAEDIRKAGSGERKAAPSREERGQAPAAVEVRPPAAAGVPMLETTIIPLSAMRRTIAKRLGESIGPIPHFFLTADLDVTELMSMRQQMIEITGSKISLNDFIIRAIALALRHHPMVNASWGEDAITQHGEVHIGVAVATTDGLITPVIREADTKSVGDIAAEIRVLADKAKNRKLKPEEYQGSTFTISNLGAWGINEFTAIINPPNAAILAIGAAEARPVVDANRQIVVRDRMKVTMSCDHRLIDGAVGAEFLKTLRMYIEQPLRLVV